MTTATASPPGESVASDVVVGSLARRETLRLVRHPLVVGGALLSLLMLATGSGERGGSGDAVQVNAAFEMLLGYALMPLAIGTCLACQLLASRDVRDGTLELTGTLPAPPVHRMIAGLAALMGPLVLAAVVILIGATLLSAWDGVPVALTSGTANLVPHPAELAQGVVAVAFFGALGLAFGAWLPSRVTLVVLLAALLFLFTVVGWYSTGWARWALPMTHHEYGVSRWVQATEGAGYNVVTGYDRVALSWHIAYVAMFTLLLGAVAALRTTRTRTVAVVTTLLAVATVFLSLVQMP